MSAFAWSFLPDIRMTEEIHRTKWLSNKGYEFRHAVDGQAGVSVYSEEGPFEYVIPES